jgi:hypothetical protein
LAPQPASAIPNGLPHANQITNIEHVLWVCNPGRWVAAELLWRHGFYPVPRFGRRHWGHRGWRRW